MNSGKLYQFYVSSQRMDLIRVCDANYHYIEDPGHGQMVFSIVITPSIRDHEFRSWGMPAIRVPTMDYSSVSIVSSYSQLAGHGLHIGLLGSLACFKSIASGMPYGLLHWSYIKNPDSESR